MEVSMINYILKPNTLERAGQPATGFHAQTVQSEERTTADCILIMAGIKGGATAGEAAQWLDVMRRALISELARGCNVNVKGFFTAGVNLKGNFPFNDSPLDPAVNTLHPSVSFSRDIFRAIEHSPVRRVTDAASGIYIESVYDVASGAENSTLTPGMVLQLHGRKIKLAGDDPSVGVSFIDANDGHTLVPKAAVSRNGDRRIDLVIPLLPAGVYRVKVTTMHSSSKALLAAPRDYTYPVDLTVDVTP
jgi:hypothetical protein